MQRTPHTLAAQEAGEESFEDLPAILHGVARDLIRAVHELEDRMLLVLDADNGLDDPSREAEGATPPIGV